MDEKSFSLTKIRVFSIVFFNLSIIGTVYPKHFPVRNKLMESHVPITMDSELRFTYSHFPPGISNLQVQGG